MPGKIGRFEVLKKLGEGVTCKVKLGVDTETGRNVAIKILNKKLDLSMRNSVKNEIVAMQKLEHINVIKLVECGTGTYEKEDSNKSRTVDYIVLEIASGGEVFDFIANTGEFEERIARYYFKQLLDGLDYVHMNGHSHRDLKPENILLDHQFDLKIADFGFAAPIEGKDGQGNLTTHCGTKPYMAPEQHLRQPYQGRSIDLFAAATILFIMVAGHPPFTTA